MITMDIEKIMNLLPHRYPFLLIDSIVEIKPNEMILAKKNVTINEPQFTGHFPSHPVMPGVLIIEAMAQASAVLVINSGKVDGGEIVYLTGIDKAKFRKPVTPGDTLILRSEVMQSRASIWKCIATATVNESLVAKAEITAILKPK